MFIRGIVSLTLVLNPLAAYAGPKEEAQKAIQQSHVAASTHAKALVSDDINALLVEMSRKAWSARSGEVPQVLADISALYESVRRELEKADSLQTIDAQELNQIILSYRKLIRERFAASFKVQQVVYDRELAVRSFELLFARFDNLCKTGRSQAKRIENMPDMPRIPSAQYQIYVGTGENPEMKSSSLNANSASKDRDQAAQVLYGSTGIASSIALSGGTGAAVGMAMTAAPFMLGASLAVAVILAAVASHEQMMLENELADAQVDLMINAASDRDIAMYYQNYCAVAGKIFAPIQDKLTHFYYSDETREKLLSEVRSSRAQRTLLRAASQKVTPARNLIGLVQNHMNGKCIPAHEKSDKATCVTVGSKISLVADMTVSFDSKSEADEERLKKAVSDLDTFNKEYPSDLMASLQSDEILDILLLKWNDMTQVIANARFGPTDALMNLLGLKVQGYLRELQRAQNSLWNNGDKLLGIEAKHDQEFTVFKAQYFKLLNTSVAVIFGKYDAQNAMNEYTAFRKSYEVFASKVFLNKSVQSLSLSVKALGDFYGTL
jgi:hypothetical protein